jgi:hypothetical protein
LPSVQAQMRRLLEAAALIQVAWLALCGAALAQAVGELVFHAGPDSSNKWAVALTSSGILAAPPLVIQAGSSERVLSGVSVAQVR